MANGPETHPIWTIHLQKCAFTEQYRPVTPNWVAQKMYCLEKQTIYLWSRHSEYLTRLKLHNKQLMNLCEVLMYWRKVSVKSVWERHANHCRKRSANSPNQRAQLNVWRLHMTYPCVCYMYRTNGYIWHTHVCVTCTEPTVTYDIPMCVLHVQNQRLHMTYPCVCYMYRTNGYIWHTHVCVTEPIHSQCQVWVVDLFDVIKLISKKKSLSIYIHTHIYMGLC